MYKGSLDKDGYGKLSVNINGKWISKRAHRWALESRGIEIPKGKVVMHLCDNPSCINIDHLKIGTIQENNQDKKNKLRHAYGQIHPSTKLTEEDVNYIRTHYVRGYKNKIKSNASKLAKKFKLTDQSVRNIANYKTWRHI